MNSQRLKQFNHESETWKREIAFMLEENINLKNRLSEVLKEEVDQDLLLNLEIFQTNFVKEDNTIIFLKNEVLEVEKLLIREIFEDGEIEKQLTKKMRLLRQKLTLANKNFLVLKKEFNNFLLTNT